MNHIPASCRKTDSKPVETALAVTPAVVLADFLLISAPGLFWVAARMFRGAPVKLVLAVEGAAIWVCLHEAFGFAPKGSIGLALAYGTGAAYTFLTAREFWVGRGERLSGTGVALGLLLVHVALYGGRAADILLPGSGADSAGEPLWSIILAVEAMMHAVGMGVVLLLMARERAERQARQHLAAAAEAARAATDAKSRLFARLSHELRTPLHAMNGFADLLADDRSLAGEPREMVLMVRQAGQHLLALVNDILDLSRIEAGRLVLNRGPLAVSRMLQDCVGLVQQAAVAGRVALSLSVAPDVPDLVVGDRLRVKQILLNLLANAVKFTPPGGAVSLGVSMANAEEEVLRFAVVDSGSGIPEGKRHLLFQDFSQIEEADRRNSSGAGLGLAVSRALADVMAGRIGCETAPGGTGSLFWVELPMPTVPLGTPNAPAPAPALAGRNRVRAAGISRPGISSVGAD